MKNKHFIIKKLIETAKKSDVRCKHAAAIVKNGHILSVAHNYIKTSKNSYTVHAERAVLNNCNKKKLKGASLFVIRWDKGNINKYNDLLISKPCKKCEKFILKISNKFNLKKIYYSTNSTTI